MAAARGPTEVIDYSWFATDAQLLDSPSRKEGISAETEFQLRLYGCELIQEGGMLLRLCAAAAHARHAALAPSNLAALRRATCALLLVLTPARGPRLPRRRSQAPVRHGHRAGALPPLLLQEVLRRL